MVSNLCRYLVDLFVGDDDVQREIDPTDMPQGLNTELNAGTGMQDGVVCIERRGFKHGRMSGETACCGCVALWYRAEVSPPLGCGESVRFQERLWPEQQRRGDRAARVGSAVEDLAGANGRNQCRGCRGTAFTDSLLGTTDRLHWTWRRHPFVSLLLQIGLQRMSKNMWLMMTPEQKDAYFARERRMEAAWRRRQQLEKERREDPDGLTLAGMWSIGKPTLVLEILVNANVAVWCRLRFPAFYSVWAVVPCPC